MSWEDQGRQSHGWFGHGTAPAELSDPKFTSSATSASKGDPILALAYGAVASFPATQRSRAEAQFQGSNLARFRQAAASWMRGNRMDQTTFADRFFGRDAEDSVAQKLRDAADLARSAATPADMAKAAGKLADAMREVGLDRWSRFLADAQARASDPATEAAIAQSRQPAQASINKDFDPRGVQLAAGGNPRGMMRLNDLAGRFWGKILPPSKPVAPSPQPTSPSEQPVPPPSAPSRRAPSETNSAPSGPRLAPDWIPPRVQSRLPSDWGTGEATSRGEGWRWTDPANQGNGVRIDRGNPNNSQPIQQNDHVVVRSGGRVIGRDGQPIAGSIAQNAEQAHIPLSEYQGWATWDHP